MYFGATPFSASAFSDVGFNPNAFVNVVGSRLNLTIGNSTISGDARFSVTGNRVNIGTSDVTIVAKARGEKTTVSLRPERAIIDPQSSMDNNYKGKIEEVIYHGDHTRLRVDLLGNKDFILKVPNSTARLDLKKGNELNIGWNSVDCRALDPK